MKYIIHNNFYDRQAVELARKIVDKNNELKISYKKNETMIETNNEILFKEFMNEVLNQDLRLITIKKNENIIKLIYTKALYSALKGNKEE